METKYQTSFIPKKPLTATSTTQTSSISLFLLVSIILFFVSLGMAGYVYMQKATLIKAITESKKTITDNSKGLSLDENTINSFVELDSRIKASKILLDAHVAISPIFDFLKENTLKTVRFKNFSFNSAGKDSGGDQKISVQMSGVARNWETVALQADEFGKPEVKNIITEPKISNLSLNIDGSVSFVFSAYVTPKFLNYKPKTIN